MKQPLLLFALLFSYAALAQDTIYLTKDKEETLLKDEAADFYVILKTRQILTEQQ